MVNTSHGLDWRTKNMGLNTEAGLLRQPLPWGHPPCKEQPLDGVMGGELFIVYQRLLYPRITSGLPTYGPKASEASPAKRSEPVWTAIHITHATTSTYNNIKLSHNTEYLFHTTQIKYFI